MKLVGGDWIIAMDTPERDTLVEALEDAVNRYEAADEHDGDHYKTLRALLETLAAE
ncbi:hypothetical protein UFOVP1157_49 [uncultured Caudovirales phage]|uniref:Uncharacterized protein n=1 Tax=uncultured Caudovirales phage TaxID=2100421 RepID=A0A6J5QIA9_9CAUD|nr:hypothetical protein UFOVP497_46 [uncultured Caudovirales phage]CAB4164363.1 hypothetical protein UFOVP834_22 [uncultured Caudovirales phage]CAB4172392.1 hypothetical protein UFOVP922_49 [uncultured Caudovirales phage]CAB4177735.1 hypothetical protein UFOVP1006_42 [uncultured Caudovirales phage]CAB4184063.1 hypothetical protein UFOVP1096_38 [uncultured Caudovirales phage]